MEDEEVYLRRRGSAPSCVGRGKGGHRADENKPPRNMDWQVPLSCLGRVVRGRAQVAAFPFHANTVGGFWDSGFSQPQAARSLGRMCYDITAWQSKCGIGGRPRLDKAAAYYDGRDRAGTCVWNGAQRRCLMGLLVVTYCPVLV